MFWKVVTTALVVLWAWSKKEKEKEKEKKKKKEKEKKKEKKREKDFSDYGSGGIYHSNPGNNHDDQKYQHPSRESAEREARRMQQGESRKVNAYYNHELGGWYVGRSKEGY
jgi:hypothetical protein